VLDEPGVVRELVERTAPHLPVQRYFKSGAEMRSQSGPGEMIVAPNFRGDWATAKGRVEGIEPLLENERFREAAAELFGSDLVRPWGVYSNITWQLPFDQGRGHTDVPAFLGIDRTHTPTWFLSAMGHSGLFEEERVEIATAVSWFYQGTDGGFCYWPDGPERAPRVHEGRIFNTAFVGDNDRMYHRVRPVGRRERGLLAGMTLDTALTHDGGDDWAIRQGDETLAEMPYHELRISVSWKAYVYRDAEQRRRHEEGHGGLCLDAVLARFADDLDRRGIDFEPPSDPLHDEPFVDLLTASYVRAPRVFDT
jgi:hypothetical protein